MAVERRGFNMDIKMAKPHRTGIAALHIGARTSAATVIDRLDARTAVVSKQISRSGWLRLISSPSVMGGWGSAIVRMAESSTR
jgi:hypothetical protein